MSSDDFGLPPLEEILKRDREKGSSDGGGVADIKLSPLSEILDAYDEGDEDCSSEDIDYFTGTDPSKAMWFYLDKGRGKFNDADHKGALAYFKAALPFWSDECIIHWDIIKTQKKLGNWEEVEYHKIWSERLDARTVAGKGASFRDLCRDSSFKDRYNLQIDWRYKARQIFGNEEQKACPREPYYGMK